MSPDDLQKHISKVLVNKQVMQISYNGDTDNLFLPNYFELILQYEQQVTKACNSIGIKL